MDTSRLGSAQRAKISKAAAIQQAARKSLTKLLGPLSAFVLDCGLSVSEANALLRTAAVQTAAARQLENGRRINISGIAALTGIPRAEVSRILTSRESPAAMQGRQSTTSRILSAWHRDPAYLTASRCPQGLKIFGRRPTFESLVKAYGQGIPTRAVLDELKRAGAIELLSSSQEILPKMPIPINPRLTRKRIRDFDATFGALFLCLLNPSDTPLVVSGTKEWSGTLPLIRRTFGRNAIELLQELRTKLALKVANRRPEDTTNVVQLSVKIVYKEARRQSAKDSPKSRHNFRRIPSMQPKCTSSR